ncbi:hypothetical protein H8K38_13045 [Undibacterium sp. FT79W]|uniref:hypothetical protein n=1 Tax=Undibacterium sp. FT79W TaxID=2762296 RepID=UPI00164C9A18|nr:hypothetical protein [Undibacterium sp. FT79W]MBC3878738.1 hypothetical protein [Undibacterium sp. FT79W]
MKSKNLWSVTSVCVALLSGLFATVSFAKLPEPTPEAKAKAAEAKAKTAWSDKVAAYQLCKSQDKVAAAYLKGKDAKAVVATPACTDPGPYVPEVAATPASASAASAVAATTPAGNAPVVPKK